MYCPKNCMACDQGQTKKDRENCEKFRERRNYYRRMAYRARKEYLKNKQAN